MGRKCRALGRGHVGWLIRWVRSLVNVVGGDDGPTRVHETSLESWEKVV